MAVTAIGKVYARRIHDGSMALSDVPEKRKQDTKDSYMELYGTPCPEE